MIERKVSTNIGISKCQHYWYVRTRRQLDTVVCFFNNSIHRLVSTNTECCISKRQQVDKTVFQQTDISISKCQQIDTSVSVDTLIRQWVSTKWYIGTCLQIVTYQKVSIIVYTSKCLAMDTSAVNVNKLIHQQVASSFDTAVHVHKLLHQ